eukprot:1188608-Prorocentrum_minimum.AAC.2
MFGLFADQERVLTRPGGTGGTARWDGGEPGSSSSDDDDDDDDDDVGAGGAAAAAAVAKKGKKSKKGDKYWFGLTRYHMLVALMVFVMLGELLMFLDSANFWKQAGKQVLHNEF